MAAKLIGKAIGAAGNVLGIGGSAKAAVPAATPAAKVGGPIVTKLGGSAPVTKKLRDKLTGQPTILSDKLGN